MTFPNYLYNWTPHVHDAYGVFLFINKTTYERRNNKYHELCY